MVERKTALLVGWCRCIIIFDKGTIRNNKLYWKLLDRVCFDDTPSHHQPIPAAETSTATDIHYAAILDDLLIILCQLIDNRFRGAVGHHANCIYCTREASFDTGLSKKYERAAPHG